MSLLCEAAASGSISRCRQLLEAGNDVKENENGRTPLLFAAVFGHTNVCELLLEEGKANIEETEPKGNTALKQAASEGHASTVALLLSKGARVDTRNEDGFTPLLSAVKNGHKEVFQILIEGGACDLEERIHPTEYTALHEAAIRGHIALVELLISHKADLNSRSRTEATPLLLASQEGHLASVVTLLQAGADPLLPQVDGALPIHQAVANNHPEVVRILIEQDSCSIDQVRFAISL